jgi:hypothetical protein
VDLRRLKPIDLLTGLCGSALIGLLWAPWYRAHGSLNAWHAMAVNDVIFFVAGVFAIWVVVATALYSTAAVPIAAAAFATFAGLLAFVLALIRLIFPPDLGPGPTIRALGAWLGTAAALGVAASAARSMHDERRSPPGTANVSVTELPARRVGEEGTGA